MDSPTQIQNATKDKLNYVESNYGGFWGVPPVVNDYRPDEFSFSFLNLNGSFYLDETRHWKVRCDRRVKVEFDDNDMLAFEQPWASGIQNAGFGKFTLTDVDGIKYVFGGTYSAIEYSSNLFSIEISPIIPKTWNITQIILPNNEVINFTYKRGDRIMQPITEPFNTHPLVGWESYFNTLSGSLIFPSYLTSIDTKLEHVRFNSEISTELAYSAASFDRDYGHWFGCYNDWLNVATQPYSVNYLENFYFNFGFMNGLYQFHGNNPSTLSPINFYKLSSIIVSDKQNNDVKQFSFNYNNDPNKRLKLLSLNEISTASGNSNRQFSFIYNEAIDFPPYLSDKLDRWGYFNNTTPDYTNTTTLEQSRMPNGSVLQAQVISKIIYPTKGYTIYKFEPHIFFKQLDLVRSNPLISLQTDAIGGGLRIQEVDNFDANGTLTNWKKYAYVNNYSPNTANQRSSGILGGVYLQNVSTSLKNSSGNAYLTSLIPAASNNNGGLVGYSEVTELFSDGSYKINNFSNFDNGINGEYMDESPNTVLSLQHPADNQSYTQPSAYTNFTSNAFLRGKLLRERIFSSNGSILNDHVLNYNAINKSSEYVRNITTEFDGSFSSSVYNYDFAGTAFKTYTYAYLLSSETDIKYQSLQSPISQTKNYTYDPVTLNLKTITTNVNSKGEVLESNNLYPSDMIELGRDPNSVSAHMKANNNVSVIVENTQKVGGLQTTLHRTDYIEPYTSLFKPGSEIVQQLSNNPKLITAYKFDEKGNAVNALKNGIAGTSYIYGYQKNLPIAKADNASDLEIFHENFEETGAFGLAHTGNRYKRYDKYCFTIYWR